MAKAWQRIKEEYINCNGAVLLKDIAKKYSVNYSTLRSRKNRERWDDEIKNVATNNATQRNNVATPDKKTKEIASKAVEKLEDAELTEKQRLFCLYYVKSFNATQSAIKAGYSADTAHVQGPRLLGNVRVKEEIRRLKGSMTQDIFIDAMDVLKKYIEIAFADVTDYVTFGQREVQAMGASGPIYEGEDKKPVMKTINYVDLKESNEVDGTILSEVSQGKDGVKVKLLDKMKALEKLELYFDLFPDKWKRQIEEEKLKLAARKAGEDDNEENIDDGFLEAIKGEVSEVWSDEEI